MQRSTFFAALLCVAALGSWPALQAQSASLQVIATGLDNPRGLAFGSDGFLYVAEAGRGGTSTACVPSPDQPTVQRCYGPSGAITRIAGVNDHRRVVVGLPSLAGPSGAQASGPQDIGFGMGRAWVTIGYAGDPATRAPLEAAGARMARLVRVENNGQWTDVVDLGAFEASANPDGRQVDTNPFKLVVLADRAIIVDAGGNSLVQVSSTGAVSSLASFGRKPLGATTIDPVPTSVAVADNGDYFVGELTGAPFPVGAAQVYRVPRAGGTPQVVATGFTTIIDVAFTSSGVGYVLEHDSDGIIPPLGPGVNGRLVRVNANGTQTVVASAGLVKPGGMAIGPDGAIYVTTQSDAAGTGQVVRIGP